MGIRAEARLPRSELAALAPVIVRSVGGRENVDRVCHCYSYLRFRLFDKTLVDEGALRDACSPRVVNLEGELKVFIGRSVFDLYDEVAPLVARPKGPGLWQRVKALLS